MKTNFMVMNMPEDIQIAVLVDEEGLIESKTLLVMRNEAWRIVAGLGFFEEEEVADLFAPESHLGSSEQIVDNSVSLARELCSKY